MTIRRLQIVAIALTVTGTFLVELLSDTVLDSALPFPLDTVAVSIAVLIGAAVISTLALRSIERLERRLRAQNAELERRNSASTALHALAASVAALARLDEILESTTVNARRLVSADVAVLVLTAADGSERLAAQSGPAAAIAADGDEPSPDPGRPDARRFLRAAYATAYLAVPVRRGDLIIGALAVGASRSRAFTVGDVETLGSLAAEAAIAIEHDRLQRELRTLAVHAERAQLAREMHDGLAQVLGYVNTKSQAVEELLAAGKPAEARIQMRELAAAARSTYVDVRESIVGLSTPLVGPGGGGLDGVLERYGRQFAERAKLAVTVEADGSPGWDDLPAEVMANLLRIVQEALTNVRKHAAAQRVAVRLERDDHRIRVTVEDDGRGFDPGSSEPGSDWPHFGRETIRQRAAAIGGVATWVSAPGRGTRLRIEVPMDAGPDGAAGPARTAT